MRRYLRTFVFVFPWLENAEPGQNCILKTILSIGVKKLFKWTVKENDWRMS